MNEVINEAEITMEKTKRKKRRRRSNIKKETSQQD